MDPTRVLSAAYPAPPAYYKNYTDENLALVKAGGTAFSTTDNLSSQLSVNLKPPNPVLEPISVFGTILDISSKPPSLESLGIPQLSKSTLISDRAENLKKLNHSLLINFYELLELLETDPTNTSYKIEHIRLILINFHSLLNEYRPHQARDTLAIMMRDQIRRRKETTQSIRDEITKAQTLSADSGSDTLMSDL
ncbi:hypothetical protein BDV3_004144 [Batrachochytrium dendrobatidis]